MTILSGEEATYTVTLTNTGYLRIPLTQKLQVAVEGDIESYVTISQPNFPRVFRRNDQVSFDVTVSVPTDAPEGVLEGQLVLQRVVRNRVTEVWRAEPLLVRVEWNDTVGREISILYPRDNERVFDERITVIGAIDDDSAIVDVNGIHAEVVKGSFAASDVPLVDGPNHLVATASDIAGHISTSTIEVEYDSSLRKAIRVVSGATLLSVVSPGAAASVLGSELSSDSITADWASDGDLPEVLGETTVQVNGVYAPLMRVSPTRIDFLIPDEIGQGEAHIIVASTVHGVLATGSVHIQSIAPGLFRSGGVDVDHSGALEPSPRPIAFDTLNGFPADGYKEFLLQTTGLGGTDINSIDVLLTHRDGSIDSIPILASRYNYRYPGTRTLELAIPRDLALPSVVGLTIIAEEIKSDTEYFYFYDSTTINSDLHLLATDYDSVVRLYSDVEPEELFPDGFFVRPTFTDGGIAVSVEPSGPVPFEVSIEVYYGAHMDWSGDELNQLSVYHIDKNGQVTELQDVIVDKIKHTISFRTDRFSDFVIVAVPPKFLQCVIVYAPRGAPLATYLCLKELVDAVENGVVNSRCQELVDLYSTLAFGARILNRFSSRLLYDWMSGEGSVALNSDSQDRKTSERNQAAKE